MARLNAAISLAELGQHRPAVRGFIRALKSREVPARWSAAAHLGSIGKKVAPAIPALRRALRDEDLLVRKAAAEALDLIRGAAKR